MTRQAESWLGLELSGGRYQIVALLGEGGMGYVYRAFDHNLDAEVVVKVPRRSQLDDPEFAPRFAGEIRSLVALAHPNVVRITDVGSHEELPFAVMQYLSGGSLENRVRRGAVGRRLPEEPGDLANWLPPIAAALDFVHAKGYVHRDVKPANILFDGHGHAFLSDFGIAKAMAAQAAPAGGLTGAGMVLGTPEYMAPELILGEPYDGKADQYALAVVVYECLGGRHPFPGATGTAVMVRHSTQEPPPLRQVCPTVPEAVSEAVHRALAKAPARRHADCSAFTRSVLEAATEVGRQGAPRSPSGPIPRPAGPPSSTRTRAWNAAEPGSPQARLTCPACQAVLRANEAMRGARVRCPACKTKYRISEDLVSLEPVEQEAGGTVLLSGPRPEPEGGPPTARSTGLPPALPVQDEPTAQELPRPEPEFPTLETGEAAAGRPRPSRKFRLVAAGAAVVVLAILGVLMSGSTDRADLSTDGAGIGPSLLALSDLEIDPGQQLRFPVAPEEQAGRWSYRLDPGAPEGARINPATGVFSWTPGTEHAGRAFPIQVRVGDDRASEVRSFVVSIRRAPGEGGPSILRGHDSEISGVVISPDGRRALSGGHDGTLRLWDLGTGAELLRLEVPSGRVEGLAFTPDGRRAVTGSEDGAVRLWDLDGGQEIRLLKGHAGPVRGVAVSPDGRVLMTGGDDQTVRLWDLETGQQRHRLDGHTGRVFGVAISADGRFGLSASRDWTLRLWDLDTGALVRRLTEHESAVNAVVFLPDGDRALSTGDDGTIRLWDLDTGAAQLRLEGHTGRISSLSVSADGRRALSGGRDGTARLWDLAFGTPIDLFEGHEANVRGVAFTPDGHRALSASNDGTIRLWDVPQPDPDDSTAEPPPEVIASKPAEGAESTLAPPREVRLLLGHDGPVTGLALPADGRTLLSGGRDGTLRLWDVETGREVRQLPAHGGPVTSLAVTPDGRAVFVGHIYGALCLWDVSSGQEICHLLGHSGRVLDVDISADGRRGLSGSGDRSFRVWDLAEGKAIRQLEAPAYPIEGVALAPDNDLALYATQSSKRGVGIYRIQSRQETHLSGGVQSLAISRDGRSFLTGSRDGLLRLYDTASTRTRATLKGHLGPIYCVALSPDGRLGLSGGGDGTVRLWDLEGRSERTCYTGHDGYVHSVALSDDGQYAASASGDGSIRIWSLPGSSMVPLLEPIEDTESPEPALAGAAERPAPPAEAEAPPDPEGPQLPGEVRRFAGHSGRVTCLDFTKDGRFLLSGGIDRSVCLWDVESGEQVRRVGRHNLHVTSLAVSANGRTVLSGGGDLSARLWDADSGKQLHHFEGHTQWIFAVDLSADGRLAVSGASDRTLRVWDTATGAEIRRVSTDSQRVLSVALSPDAESVVYGTGPPQWTAVVQRIEGDGPPLELKGHRGDVGAVAFSPDGRSILTGCDDTVMRLWDARSGALQAEMKLPGGVIRAVAFSPDGRRALSGGRDRSVRLWDLEDQSELARFAKHSGTINGVAFSPDGHYAASAGDDGLIILWRLPAPEPPRDAEPGEPDETTAGEPDGRIPAPDPASPRPNHAP